MRTDFSKTEQENILVLLCWSEKAAPIIYNTVQHTMFSKVYDKVAYAALDFYGAFKTPIKHHLPDDLEDELEGDQKRLFRKVIDNIISVGSKQEYNEDYVLRELQKFVKRRNMMGGIEQAHKYILEGDTESAERVWESTIKDASIIPFDPGLSFGADVSKTMDFMNTTEGDGFSSGVRHLDYAGVVPERGKMYVVVAKPGVGKTWFCINMAKMNVLLRQKVLHVTLEMDEKSISRRYVQAFYSASKSHLKYRPEATQGAVDDFNRLKRLKTRTLKRKDVRFLDNKEDLKHIITDMGKYGSRFGNYLRIKEFPGGLTPRTLNAYLDRLVQIDGFMPDVMIVDYPELMDLDSSNYRISLGRTNVELLRICKERNMALVFPFQGNRDVSAKRVMWIDEQYLSEDYSVFKHADHMISLNQLPGERDFDILRVYCVKSREEATGLKLVMFYNYSIGQICLGSTVMGSDRLYYNSFKDYTGNDLLPKKGKKK